MWRLRFRLESGGPSAAEAVGAVATTGATDLTLARVLVVGAPGAARGGMVAVIEVVVAVEAVAAATGDDSNRHF